jgi:nucleoside-diphosphate-sugar epimerase
MTKILITGVTGFIGTHLAQRLSEEGYEVYGLAKHSVSRNTEALETFLKGTKFYEADIADYHAISNIIKKLDPNIIINLAALSPVRNSFEHPLSYIQTNVVGTANIAHAILDLPNHTDKKLVHASTAEVFGFQEVQPMHEDLILKPSSPYANSKAMNDTYLRMLHQVYGFNVTVMRCTNTYGRKIDKSFFIEYLIDAMLKKETIHIGAPDSVRDYMYINDHIEAYIAVINNPRIGVGEAFNAGPGVGISNKDIAYKIGNIIGFDKNKIKLGEYPSDYPSRPLSSDQPFIVLDATKINKVYGWSEITTLEEGLEKTIEYWKQKRK